MHSIKKSGFLGDFQIRILDFLIKREIQNGFLHKLANPNLDFIDLLILCFFVLLFFGEIRKRIREAVLLNGGLSYNSYICACIAAHLVSKSKIRISQSNASVCDFMLGIKH